MGDAIINNRYGGYDIKEYTHGQYTSWEDYFRDYPQYRSTLNKTGGSMHMGINVEMDPNAAIDMTLLPKSQLTAQMV